MIYLCLASGHRCLCEGDLNAGGNHRKSLVTALEASLRQLRTDYVDILWLHA
jgi:aryl-alcohol dehydrogenase-like predicted oxidoreductase